MIKYKYLSLLSFYFYVGIWVIFLHSWHYFRLEEFWNHLKLRIIFEHLEALELVISYCLIKSSDLVKPSITFPDLFNLFFVFYVFINKLVNTYNWSSLQPLTLLSSMNGDESDGPKNSKCIQHIIWDWVNSFLTFRLYYWLW